MFGIDDALIWGPLIGSALGGLSNRKDPLKGALLGGAAGALGGAGLGAMGTAGAAGGAAGGAGVAGLLNPLTAGATSGGGFLSATPVAMGVSGLAPVGLSGSAPSLIPAGMGTTATGGFGAINAANPSLWTQMKDGASIAGNVGNAAKVANTLFGPQEQPMPVVQTPPPSVGQGGSQTLSSLAQGDMNKSTQIAQEAEMKRKRRMGLLGAG